MLNPDYPLRTDRLVLRPLVAGDIDAMHAYQSLPDVCRYIPYEPRSREDIATRVADPKLNRSRLDEAGQVLWIGAALPGTDTVIGDMIIAWTSAEHRTAEIGYVFHPDVHGRGYATEAARALLALAFDQLGVRRVTARLDARNEASAGVLRRIGMRQEAHLRQNEWFKGEWTDELGFAILESEYRTAQP